MKSFLLGATAGGILTALAFVLSSSKQVPSAPAELFIEDSHPLPEEPAVRTKETTILAPPQLESPIPESEVGSDRFLATAPWDRSAQLSVRVIDVDGTPLASQSLRVAVRYGDYQRTRYVTSDAEGGFLFEVRGALPDGRVGTLEVFPETPSDRLTLYTPPTAVATTRIPDPLPQGLVNLGEIRLTGQPVVVTGKILDPDNKPVAGAAVHIELRGKGHPDGTTLWQLATDSDGRFALSKGAHDLPTEAEEPLFGSLTVEASGLGFVELPFEPGAAPVVIRLREGTDVEGTIHLASSELGSQVTVVLIDALGQERSPQGRSIDADGAMTFWIRNVPLGAAHIEVWDSCGRSYRTRLTVSSDGITPRLDNIDFR